MVERFEVEPYREEARGRFTEDKKVKVGVKVKADKRRSHRGKRFTIEITIWEKRGGPGGK